MEKFGRKQDNEIISRIQMNDRTVLGEVFQRYKRMIFSYIRKFGGSDHEADDILQESIIVLWQKVNGGQFLLTSGLGTYLLGIAKNKWMSEVRKKKRYSGSELKPEIHDGNPTSLQSLISEERISQVKIALNRLDPVCRKILLLFYFEEMSMDKIAREMKFANTDVVKSKKYQCKKYLEQILQNLMKE